MADQGRDPRTLSLQRLSRRQYVRASGRLPPLFQRPAGEARRDPGGDARGDGQGAVPPRPDPQLQAGPGAREDRDRDHGPRRSHDPAGSEPAEAPEAQGRAAEGSAHGNLFRRLGAAHGPSPRRGRLWRRGGADDPGEPAAEARAGDRP